MNAVSIEIPARHLASVTHFTAKKDIRFYLNGALIEATASETRVIGTDGHAIAIHRSECTNSLDGANVVSVLVPNDTLSVLSKLSPKDGTVTLTSSDGRWEVGTAETKVNFRPIEGRFPDYRAVVPDETSGELAQFNPQLLVKFSKAAKALGASQYPIIQHNGSSGAVVTLGAMGEFVGVVMPLNPKSISTASSAWAKEQVAA